jgi:hypothetical protein
LLRRVVCSKFTEFIDVSDVLAASIIRAILPDYTAQQPRRQPAIFILAAVKILNLKSKFLNKTN